MMAPGFRLLGQSHEAGTGINGQVTDLSGAAVPGAHVAVTGPQGPVPGVETDVEGMYTLIGLSPGTYSISIAASGFKEFHPDPVVVGAGQLTRIDAKLSLADAAGTTVDVEGSRAGQVELDKADVSGTITQKEVVTYQLNGRNFTQLIALAPGVSNQTGQDEAKVGVVGSVKYSVNGGRVEYNTFEVDGADLLNTGINGASSTLIVYPSLDAIQEIRVLTSNYGAMYGRTASGTVLVDTKSGAERFHGNLYYFGRNEFFNARNFFDETNGAPLYRRLDGGGTIGGPLYIPGRYNQKKDKTFFFWSEEGRLEKSPYQYNQGVPSMAERAGDFDDVCPASGSKAVFFSRQAYPDCPAENNTPYGVNSKGQNLYLAFPANNLANGAGDGVSAINRNAAAILATGVIPAPNATSGCNSTISSCYVGTVSPETDWLQELFRIDHNFNTNTRLTLRFIHDYWKTELPTPYFGLIQNSFPTIQNNFVGPGTSFVTRLTETLSPTVVNEVVFTYGNSTISLTDEGDYQRPAELSAPCSPDTSLPNAVQCPVGYLFNNGFGGKLPGIVIQGPNGAYGGNGFSVDPSYMPWTHKNPVFTLGDGLTKVIGKHSLQMGGQWLEDRRTQTNGPIGAATGDVQGIFTFGSVDNLNSTGNSFADFLYAGAGPSAAGHVKSFTQDSAQLSYKQGYQIGEPYFQDDWRVTPRLTLNLGLRVSLFGTYSELNGDAYNWEPGAFNPALAATASVDPYHGYLVDNSGGANQGSLIPLNLNDLDPRITNGLVHCGTDGVPKSCMKGHLFNPAPRVGFAWDPTGSGKTSLRGGYGIFYEHGTGNESNTGSLEASSPLVLNMTQNYPIGWGCIGAGISGVCALPATPAFPLNVTSIPTKAQWPYVQQWSLGLQRELPSKTIVTVAYVGSKGTHLTDQRQLNQLPPVPSSENPFSPNEPIIPYTAPINQSPQGDCGGFDGNNFYLTNGAVISQGSPAFINMEAACYGSSASFPNPNSLRKYAGIGEILALENSANSIYNSFQTTARRVEGPLTVGLAYTYSESMDDSSDRSDNTFVNSYDLRANYARSSFDEKHLLAISYIYDISSLLSPPPTGWIKQIFGGWSLSGITVYQSGTPFSVINGGSPETSVLDNAGVANGVGVGSYPDLVGNPYGDKPSAPNVAGSFGPLLLNPGAFAAPQGLTFGDAGRNVLTNPARWNFDMALLKHVEIKENRNLEFRFEAFNAFNTKQFQIYNSNLGNQANNTINCYGGPASGYSAAGGDGVDCLTGSAFLHPISAHRPRTIQFGLKFAF